MEAIGLAGIPLMSVQGPRGGYGIVDTYRMDRQFVTVDDLFYIITSLSSIGSTFTNQKIESTIEDLRQAILSKNVEKIRALVMPDCRLHEGTIADWKDDTIRMGLLYGNPESIRVTNLELQVLQMLAKGSLLAEATRYRRRGGPKGYRAPVSLEFRLVGSQWKVSAAIVRPVDIEEW